MLKKPIHRASILALSIFGLLVLITWKPEPKASEQLAEQKWPVELELQAELGGLALSHEMVQDTLSWHAGKLAQAIPDLRSSWSYQFCCEDALSMKREEQVFQGKLSLEFPSDELRLALLNELLRLGYVDLQSAQRKGDWTCGRVNLALPVPGSDQTLLLDAVGFGLQMPQGYSSRFHQS